MSTLDGDRAARLLAARLSEASYAHSIRVAQTAESMAAAYGLDSARARLAGLLHDWDREIGPEALLATAQRSGVAVDPTERERPYLLHARTGAAAIAAEFEDLPDDVIAAVERHTLGAATMSGLDMVVFVADMIEPSRDFEGIDELRNAVGTVSLEELFARAYQRSLRHLIDTGNPLHPQTVTVWNACVARWRP